MPFPCLVLDHDDTVVQSTPAINYPAFAQSLATLRPGKVISYEEFAQLTFDPGFEPLCRDLLGYTDEEMAFQYDCWRQWASEAPPLYPGFSDLLWSFRKAGGIICVVSHSYEAVIARDYESHRLPLPDVIFGWEEGEGRRKPDPWPLQQIMKRFSLRPEELLMVDDLRDGYTMARTCRVPFAFAGWGTTNETARRFMKQHANYYLAEPAALAPLLGLPEKEAI